MVVHGMFLPTFGAGKPHAFGVHHMHIDSSLCHIQINPLYRSRLIYPQQVPVQFLAFHRSPSVINRGDRLTVTH